MKRFEGFVQRTPCDIRVREFGLLMLEEQGELLTRRVEGLTTGALEWQPEPGCNSIGMLLAHLAIAEVYWSRVVPAGIREEAAEDAEVRRWLGIGINDDGMPLDPTNGRHPPSLQGWPASRYLDLLRRARAQTLEVLRSWKDRHLDRQAASEAVTGSWILYHLVEHQTYHLGQICQTVSRQTRLGQPGSPTPSSP